MSTPHEPRPAKLFLSILYRGGPDPLDTPESSAALASLEKTCGPVDLRSSILRFDYTSY